VYDNARILVMIPMISILAAGVAVALIDRTLRRKDYARR
jgi:hypothetical protein